MRSAPLVSADQLVAVVEAYADRVADCARRLGCPASAVPEVVRRAGMALVDACNREPEAIGDLLGRWVADVRALATRARLEATSAGQPPTPTGVLAGGREAIRTAEALSGLEERRRVALLLRDSYDAPTAATAVALGLGTADTMTLVADARLRLAAALSGEPAPSLAGHEAVAGVSLATLGALADGSDAASEEADPAVRARRRHVGGCETCAAVLDAQTRARTAMSGLPVLGLSDPERDAVLTSIAGRADAALPTEEELVVAAAAGERPIPLQVIGVALVIALAIGGGIGAALRNRGDTVTSTPNGGASVILATTSAAPTATTSATPSGSLTPTATPTVTATFSPTPTATASPSTAKPTATRSRTASPTAKATKSVPVATTSAPVVTTTTGTPTDSSSPTATASSTSEAPASITATGTTGGGVSVSGTGFTPNASVTVSSNEAGTTTTTVTADASGAFATTLAGGVITEAGSTRTATASDGTHSASASYTAR